ncbi:MAG TPA: hypothetical protein VL126_15020 [Bacteroidota bacterium]|nr:hypothetical protein [Bacteroidota bacterium]
MNPGAKAVAWSCICSTLLMGCYSSALIDPASDEKPRIYSERIEYLVLKDSTKCVFDRPPFVGKDLISGQVNGKEISIPISDAKTVGISHVNGIMVILFAVGVTATVFLVAVAGSFRLQPSHSQLLR